MDPNASYAIVTDPTATPAARAEAALALLCWMADGGGGPELASDHNAINACHTAILGVHLGRVGGVEPGEHLNPDAWTDPAVAVAIRALPNGNAAAVVTAIMAILNLFGYDSVDRELAFHHFEDTYGIDYEALYNAWLAS